MFSVLPCKMLMKTGAWLIKKIPAMMQVSFTGENFGFTLPETAGLAAPEWFKGGWGKEETAWLPFVSEWGASATCGGATGLTGDPVVGRGKRGK